MGVPKQSVKKHDICSDSISADPICPFPIADHSAVTGPEDDADGAALHLGDSKNTVRGYCSDIPRFESFLNN